LVAPVNGLSVVAGAGAVIVLEVVAVVVVRVRIGRRARRHPSRWS
jgi:hypothetical protein